MDTLSKPLDEKDIDYTINTKKGTIKASGKKFLFNLSCYQLDVDNSYLVNLAVSSHYRSHISYHTNEVWDNIISNINKFNEKNILTYPLSLSYGVIFTNFTNKVECLNFIEEQITDKTEKESIRTNKEKSSINIRKKNFILSFLCMNDATNRNYRIIHLIASKNGDIQDYAYTPVVDKMRDSLRLIMKGNVISNEN